MKIKLGAPDRPVKKDSQNQDSLISKPEKCQTLTKIIATKKVLLNQISPSISETSKVSTSGSSTRSTGYKTKIIAATQVVITTPKKYFGIPANIIIALILIGSVLAVGVILKQNTRNLTITVPISYSGTDGLAFENSQSLTMVAGDIKSFSVDINNLANRQAYIKVRLTLTQLNLGNGEAKIMLDGITNETVESHQLSVANYYTISANNKQTIPFSVDLNFSATQATDYKLTLITELQ